MRTILIVDDEKTFRKRYKDMLTAEKYKVFTAKSAMDAANMLMREKNALDLVLLDINLPQVDGRDIFDIISEYAPNLEVIVTSVHPLQDQKLKIPRAVDYFNKADDKGILLQKVRKVIGAADSISDTTTPATTTN